MLFKRARVVRLYCVGMAKSGTHSIAAVFGGRLRSAHEPEVRILSDVVLRHLTGLIGDEELRDHVLERDRRLRLDVDSSLLNIYLLDQLLELFADAKFILTIRDPYTWLNSITNQQLRRLGGPRWNRLREFTYGSDFRIHPREERALKERGLYTVAGYLSGWNLHNRKVIDSVPKERLLIVRTDRISESLDSIAAFAGVSESDLVPENSHAYRAENKEFNLLEEIDRGYLRARARAHCGDLMERFFPEIE